jgi:hypothetical protein
MHPLKEGKHPSEVATLLEEIHVCPLPTAVCTEDDPHTVSTLALAQEAILEERFALPVGVLNNRANRYDGGSSPVPVRISVKYLMWRFLRSSGTIRCRHAYSGEPRKAFLDLCAWLRCVKK